MTNSLNFVLDTNILISAALFTGSVPHQSLLRALAVGKILFSQETHYELFNVLSRAKFSRYITAEIRDEFIITVTTRAYWIETTSTIQICRDPKDDKFVQLALDGQAECIVTGDQDLLNLHPLEAVQILAPNQFLQQYPAP